MENIFDRLQFIRHEEVFPTREDAYEYVILHQINGDYPTITDPSKNRPSLLGEPMVLLYESGSATKGPNVILAIGSAGNGTADNRNRTFFIDTNKTEEEIEELNIRIDELEKLIGIIPIDSDTIDMSAEQTSAGTIVSGDVKIADYRIVDGKANYNIIQTEGFKGIYAFVDMDYDPETFVLTFNVNGVTKEFQLPPDQHVVKGWYDPREESIFLKLADGSQVKVLVTKLIDEWTVLPDGQTINDYNISGQTVNYSPIVLVKTHVGSKATEHEGIYEWQDVLEADIRVADHISDNIIHKDRTGRYLYVKGTADNIKYKDGFTVKDALDNVDTRVSTSTGNLIYKRPDGIYATAMLGYKAAENKLTYTYSDGNSGEIKELEFQLNSVKILEDITYDPTKEVIVIRYIDAQGEYQRVEIPVADIIEEWDVNNEAHNIKLDKYRSEGSGKDILSADAKIHAGNNNILEDLNHELYVNGIADNIKYDVTGVTSVKDALDDISGVTDDLSNKLNQEIANREAADERIDNTIGSGFTDDPHENITAKFEQLTDKVNEEADKLQNEIDRSTSKDTEHDGKIQAIEDEIGDGFGPRNTVRDEIDNLQNEIEAVSADSASSLKDIINIDESINIDKTEATKPVISVNLSEEIEDDKPNIIKLNSDGLYAGVDLIYEFNEEVGTNQLIFKTTNGTKTYDLKTNSVVDKIYYDPVREAIIIEYTVNGHRMPDVVIPVGDLINEWRVEDGHPHAVQLEKVRVASGTSEQDVLKASVIITDDHDDNILVMDDGALYVSGSQISANTAAIDALEARMDTAENDIDALENNLEDEIARSTSVDAALDEKINQEISDRIADVDAEETRAKAAESGLNESIQNEINRSTSEEARIESKLDNEINRSTAKDQELTDAINAETVRATSAETTLQTAINNEAIRATNEEQRIEHLLQDEITRSTNKDNELGTNINNVESSLNDEISRAINVENGLRTDLTAEIGRANSAETALNTKIENEITRAVGEETRIEAKLDNEISRSVEKDSELSDAVAENASNIEIEKSRAIAAENLLQTNITAEENRAKTAEQTLDAKIDAETTRAENQEEYLLHLIYDERDNRISGDTILQNAIDSEESRAREKETVLQTSINNEITRAQTAENSLSDAITAETLRAQEADNELYQKIADETSARSTKDADLESKINQEISRAQVAENVISQSLQSEVTRSTNEDLRLNNMITAETAAREAADDALEEAIRNATLTFDDTTSIDFTKTTGNVVTADVKLQGGDNIIKLGEGLYATVSLSYDGARNTIKLVTSNGEQEAIQLNNVGSLIDGMEYDAVNRALVIKYHDAAGNPLQVSFPVNQLFNDWEVDNPSEKSAVELTKTSPSEPDDPDKLKARVLITDDHDGDGKPDQGSNNLIEIRNNGLYVDGSAFSAATASTECVEQELTAVERAVFGNQEIGVCGEGFVYQAPNGSTYINNATNINNATYILDQSIKDLSAYTENVDNKVDIVSANTDCNKKELKTVENDILGMPLLNECGEGDTYRPNEGTNYIYSGTSFNNVDIILDREIKKTNDNVDILNQKVDIISGDVECVESTVNALGKIAFGSSYTMPECGEGAQYPVASNGCIISGASSLYEADLLLDQAFCSMMDNWFLLGWDTSTNHTYIVEEGQNRYMAVDSRLSHGNHNGMSDEELVLVTNDGPYIDPTRTEFTDTNALRIVNITDGPDHTILPANNPYNGLYLSNVWDCGLYYSETEDVDAIAAAEAAGYNTNYKTDESSSAQNYNYMNNVRQGDI